MDQLTLECRSSFSVYSAWEINIYSEFICWCITSNDLTAAQNMSVLTCKCIQVQVANLMLSKSKKVKKTLYLKKSVSCISFIFSGIWYGHQWQLCYHLRTIMGNKSKHFICILFAFTETQWHLLFSLSRCTMIIRWREEGTSQNTPQTHLHTNKHSFTLVHSYVWASLSCQSWNINPISVNRTCPIQVLHIKRDLYSLRSN